MSNLEISIIVFKKHLCEYNDNLPWRALVTCSTDLCKLFIHYHVALYRVQTQWNILQPFYPSIHPSHDNDSNWAETWPWTWATGGANLSQIKVKHQSAWKYKNRFCTNLHGKQINLHPIETKLIHRPSFTYCWMHFASRSMSFWRYLSVTSHLFTQYWKLKRYQWLQFVNAVAAMFCCHWAASLLSLV